VTQFFCSRKCFKRDYYVRIKGHQDEEENHPQFPIKKCGYCKKDSRLNFDPIKNQDKFNAWGCPNCGVTNQLIWENQNRPNSYQMISQILVTFTMNMQQEPQYQTYHLPINRPENGNPDIVVLTCETLSIQDIQKKDRKKIIFS
jgi:glutaredoxin